MAVYTTIDNPELYFQTKIYTGNGTNSTAITLDGDENMQPDLVWTKCRSHTVDHGVQDSVRGVGKVFHTNSTSAEGTDNWLLSLDSDGFTLSNSNEVNQSTRTFVAWCWKESATAGFDIVTYTGNDSARTISHSLSAVPHMMIVKVRDTSDGWMIYHTDNTSGPETDFLRLDNTDATTDNANMWNDTAPTSSVFTVGIDGGVNADTESYINYLFTNIQGYSKFGTFTGNGNDNGPFVYTGFRPAWILTKKASQSSEWHIYDNKRVTFNPNDNVLSPNGNYADSINANCNTDFLSNGFKLRNSNDNRNDNGETHIYAAFAEAPFVNSKGVPCNAV